MLDESHLNVAGEQGELDRAQLIERPALAAAPRGDGLAPDRSDLFAQRLVLDLPDAGKEFCDFSDAVVGSLGCCHDEFTSISVDIFEALNRFFRLFFWLPNQA